MWNPDPLDSLDDTVEFPAVTDADEDEPAGWRVAGAQAVDGVVVIEIIPLTDAELSGEQAPNVPRADAAGREGGAAMTGT